MKGDEEPADDAKRSFPYVCPISKYLAADLWAAER